MDERLRREVRFLTTRLGRIASEQAGRKVFEAIENLRRITKQLRQTPEAGKPALSREIEVQVRSLSVDQAAAVAHAFSLFFHLVNLCEERQRVRRLREYEQHPIGAPMSLRHTFHELRRHRIPRAAVKRVLESVHVEPVLTAHPTEAKRRSVMNHVLRLGRTLDEVQHELGPAAERAIDPWIEALWLTEEIRESTVTPEIEIENTLVYLERTIYDLSAVFWQRFEEEAKRYDAGLKLPPPFLRFGSWVGADRDGNPNVTPQTSLDAFAKHRGSIIRRYSEQCGRLLGLLSLPPPPGRAGRELADSVANDLERFPATREFEHMDQPNELYRRKLRVMRWRLERTAQRAEGGYAAAEEFVSDAALLENALASQPSPRLAGVGPGRLRVTAQVHGFHAASLDFRQHSSATRAAVDELLERAGLPKAPPEARIGSIQRALRMATRPHPRDLKPGTQRAIEEFAALKRIQEQGGEAATHRFILSMSMHAADLWDLVLLGFQAGVVSCAGTGALCSSADFIPLFETYDDLYACGDILEQLLSDAQYRQLLQSRGNFQEVMLGYSDSVKDSGYMAANWALFQAQERLAQVAERHGVRLSLFHGKGGTIDRGGGLSYRMVQAQPYAAPAGILRITEQGEVISFKYSNLDIALRNVEQLVTSVLDSHLLDRQRPYQESELEQWREWAEELAVSSRRFYNELVYETPEFPGYFYQATPIDLIERLRLGSRPARRFGTRDLRNLRAIPWVFAWTQSRHFLPSWYGLGHALDHFAATRADGVHHLRRMYEAWPFFGVLIDNAEVSLAKTDLYIAGRYAALVQPAAVGQRIFGRIEQEYQRTRRLVLEISGVKELLERQPVLAESIRLRNPYVDPMNALQLRFLPRWRRSRNPDPALLRLLQITVGGIAFGMKSTG